MTSILRLYIIRTAIKEIGPKNTIRTELKLGRRGEKIPARQNVFVCKHKLCVEEQKSREKWGHFQRPLWPNKYELSTFC